MIYLDNALENVELVSDDTTFNEVANHLIKEIVKSSGEAKMLLSAKLEELKVHYYSKMAESLGRTWKHVADSYREDAHYAFQKLMNIYKQLPEEAN